MIAPSKVSTSRATAMVLGLLLSTAGCKYDLDKIYEHTANDSGAGDDGAVDAGGDAANALPSHLIELWQSEVVDDDCVRCARKDCAGENTACRNDAECLALTQCVAESNDPANLADCRAAHLAWVGESIVERALGGPYYSCVFRDECAEECGSHTDFSCLGSYSWPSTPKKQVPLTLRLSDALGGEPAANLNVKVCSIQDLGCNNPANGASGQQADADGVVELSLPTPLGSFSGYLELTGEGWYPTLVHFAWPLSQTGVLPLNIVDADSVQSNIDAADVEPDATRGLLQLRINGCSGIGTRDVTFTTNKGDASSQTWYAKPFLPNFDTDTTGDLGNGGVINVPTGLVEIVATQKTGRVEVARTKSPVRAGYLTIVLLAPLDKSQ